MPSTSSRSVCFQFANSGTCTYGERCRYDHVSGRNTVPGQGRSKQNRSRNRRKRNGSSSTRTPIDDFFSQYPAFPYRRSAPVMAEFYRMCDFFGWDRESEERRDARDDLKDAMVLQFNIIYGTNVDDISAWQNLCQVLRISPIPEGLKECRDAVKRTHVNIVDLVDRKEPVTVFATEAELSAYTIETGKYFPKENAYAGGVLRFLLRVILRK